MGVPKGSYLVLHSTGLVMFCQTWVPKFLEPDPLPLEFHLADEHVCVASEVGGRQPGRTEAILPELKIDCRNVALNLPRTKEPATSGGPIGLTLTTLL